MRAAFDKTTTAYMMSKAAERAGLQCIEAGVPVSHNLVWMTTISDASLPDAGRYPCAVGTPNTIMRLIGAFADDGQENLLGVL